MQTSRDARFAKDKKGHKEMTKFEEKEIRILSELLDTTPSGTELWDTAYFRYCELSAKQHREYRANNSDKLKAFYDEHIANKAWDDIDPEAWNWYSDYHKDVFGYRPKGITFGALEEDRT